MTDLHIQKLKTGIAGFDQVAQGGLPKGRTALVSGTAGSGKTIFAAQFLANRVAIDSLSALERISTVKGFREFVIGLTSFIKHQEIAGLFTSTTPTLMGGTSVTETHISTITDSIILLRYVELYGEMRRGVTVLKMRGSMHDKDIREFTIDDKGMHIGKPFRNVAGILAGRPTHVDIKRREVERLSRMFGEE